MFIVQSSTKTASTAWLEKVVSAASPTNTLLTKCWAHVCYAAFEFKTAANASLRQSALLASIMGSILTTINAPLVLNSMPSAHLA